MNRVGMNDHRKKAMNASARAASLSPNEFNRAPRPPPPVRPKPKRTVTAPVMMSMSSEFNIMGGQQEISNTDRVITEHALPAKGTVRALAFRFEKPTAQKLGGSDRPEKTITDQPSTYDILESAKRPRPALAGSACLRFPKPPPPSGQQLRRHTLLGGIDNGEKANGDSSHFPPQLGSTFGSAVGKRVSLEIRPREKNREDWRNGRASAPSAHGKPKRSRSCETNFCGNLWKGDPFCVANLGVDTSLRRWKSSDYVSVPVKVVPKLESAIEKMVKKTPPPAVPPKPRPPKKALSVSAHEYAEYDTLPTSPSSVFSHLPPAEQMDIRKSLPAQRQLPATPANSAVPPPLPEKPQRFSLGVAITSPTRTMATMELLNDSQLNISGHIYCAVRHGEIVEEDIDAVEDETRQVATNGEQNDDSFAAAVFGAIELATGNCISCGQSGIRVIEEDAMTNYEEIMEDTEEEETQDDEEKRYGRGLMQVEERTGVDKNSKWETCSSLTSTSADSGTSSTNTRAPTLIGFRRRSSNDRGDEDSRTVSPTKPTEDGVCTDADADKLSSLPKLEDSQGELKSVASRAPARSSRQQRPKSQFDAAANSLWRIKSDIQLNLSQAMGKIRLKVSSSGTAATPTSSSSYSANIANEHELVAVDGGRKEKKARSTFYLPTANSSETRSSNPTSISITLEAGLVDDVVSSTADSSDDEEEEEENGEWEGKNGRRGSSGDDATPTANGADRMNLPDLVPHELRNEIERAVKSRLVPPDSRSDDLSSTDSSGPKSVTIDATQPSSSVTQTECPPVRPSLVSETSCSTMASALGEQERFELIYNSRFAFSEPLYQHYRSQTASVQRNQTFSEGDGKGTISRRDKLLSTSQLGSQRTLWCELPEVQKAGLLQRMTDEERKLQEAMFEVVTSEASYLRSLNILITQFMASPKLSGNTALGSCITKLERKQLFSNILAVRDCSEKLLCLLERRLEENVMLEDVCDLLHEHLRQDCEVYIKYCSNQIYQERTLNELRRNNAEFRQVIGQLETNPMCECLNLRSFLMLPMQRVTRYPLLAAAILQRTPENSQLQATAQRAYGMAGRVVRQCNEGAKRLERIEQLIQLDQMLVYREGGPKRVALVSGSRWLIKKGIIFHLVPRRQTLGVRAALRHRRIYIFLFTDLLLITKPVEGDKRFVVKDYCQRQFVEVAALEPSCPQIPDGSNLPPDSCLILCTLMKNHRGRQVQMIVNCETETDKTRWLEAIRPASSQEDGDERIYEPWDCPQVRVVQEYHAVQEDELELEVGEIVNVLRKMPDGWFEGERLRDGGKGWFPSSLTEEILSDHIRAKNYRDRLRFINEAELLQRSIYTSDSGPGLSSSSSGTNSRRSSLIPNAAKALFRF